MDSSELNKYLGAFLGVVFVMFSVSLMSGALFHAEVPEKAGYEVVAAEPAAGADGAGAAAEPEPIGPLLASADAAAGESAFRRCAACHSIEKGGPNKIGPDLWSIVNRPIASHEGFSYSAAMKEFAKGGEEVWDYDHLSNFLLAPKQTVPGTAMNFPGIKDAKARADMIAYLRSQADEQAPLPEATAEPAAAEGEGAAPAESGEAAPADDAAPTEGAPSGEAQTPDDAQEGAAPAEGEAPAANQDEGEQTVNPQDRGDEPAAGTEAAPATDAGQPSSEAPNAPEGEPADGAATEEPAKQQ